MSEELDEQTKELTDWENPPKLTDLQGDFKEALDEHDEQESIIAEWLDNYNMTGASEVKKIKGHSAIAPKVIEKQGEWKYSSLSLPFLAPKNLFSATEGSAYDVKRVRQELKVLNYQVNCKVKKVSFMDKLVRDLSDTGTAILEINWISKKEEVQRIEPIYNYRLTQDPHLPERYLQLLQMKEQSSDLFMQYMNPGLLKALELFTQTGKALEPFEVGEEEITEIVETENHPNASVRKFSNIIIDPTCDGDISKAKFVVKLHEESLSDLRKDGRYVNLDNITTSSNDTLNNPDYDSGGDNANFEFKDEPRKALLVHTYFGEWDIHDTGVTVPIVVSWVKDTIIRMEQNPFPFSRPPFVIIQNMPKRDSLFGKSDGSLIIDNQKTIGAITRGIIDLFGRSANGQRGTAERFLDIRNERKFLNNEDYKFKRGMHPSESIVEHKYSEIPVSAFNMLQLQNNEVESYSGTKAFSSGINSQALGTNVGGARSALDAASKREAGTILRIKEGLVDVGRMFLAMNAVFLNPEEVERITDEKYVEVRKDDLNSSIDLELDVSSLEDDNERAKELSFMLQTAAPTTDPGEVRMIRAEIARLRKMPALAKRIEEYVPQPDPIEVEKQQLELELLRREIAEKEASIEKEKALAIKHITEAEANGYRGQKDAAQAELNMSKASTEVAKHRDISSDADIKDLDYLEKHLGLPHRRDMEKQDKDVKSKLKVEEAKANVQQNKQEM